MTVTGGFPLDFGGFAGLERGGLVDRDTLIYRAGEHGRRETVVPLERGVGRAFKVAQQTGLLDLLEPRLRQTFAAEAPTVNVSAPVSRETIQAPSIPVNVTQNFTHTNPQAAAAAATRALQQAARNRFRSR